MQKLPVTLFLYSPKFCSFFLLSACISGHVCCICVYMLVGAASFIDRVRLLLHSHHCRRRLWLGHQASNGIMKFMCPKK